VVPRDQGLRRENASAEEDNCDIMHDNKGEIRREVSDGARRMSIWPDGQDEKEVAHLEVELKKSITVYGSSS
jgi:hypothetical protein